MERSQNLVHRGIDSLKIIGVAGSILLASGCDHENEPDPTPATTSVECPLDRDCDGIFNSKDKYPLAPESSNDVDGDGYENKVDPYPYDPNNGITTHPVPPGTIPQPSGPQSIPYPEQCVGGKPDSDGDGYADSCDKIYDTNTKDSDNDGLPDSQDAYPYTSDRDRDGIPDGQDREPNLDQRREEQRQQEQREQQQREEERQQEQRRQEQQDNGY